MATRDYSLQPASFRSRDKALFIKFSFQASKIIKKDKNNYFNCISNADVSLTLGDLVKCNTRKAVTR